MSLVHSVVQAQPGVGLAAACAALGVSRATLYRHANSDRHPPLALSTTTLTSLAAPRAAKAARPPGALSPGALSAEEQQQVLELLLSERFMDQSPYQVWATLLDEGRYLCSVRTMYRLLGQQHLVRERRRQRRHPVYRKPELLATAPNQVWTWDITKLKGPLPYSYYCLYVILDLYSRYVVGWMVAERESQHLAQRLIAQTCHKQAIRPGQLTLHADRGAAMTARSVALLLSDLGVLKSHSRPQVSNDNPFSEAQFKTLKYGPLFPARFGSLSDARAFGETFFAWYNQEHHHRGIALLTPETVHYGRAEAVLAARQEVLERAHQAHPARFRGYAPRPPSLPPAVWINPPLPLPATSQTRAASEDVAEPLPEA